MKHRMLLCIMASSLLACLLTGCNPDTDTESSTAVVTTTTDDTASVTTSDVESPLEPVTEEPETEPAGADPVNLTVVRHISDAERRKAYYPIADNVHPMASDPYDLGRINVDYLLEYGDEIVEKDADGNVLHPVFDDCIVLNENKPIFTIDFIDSITDDNATYEFYSELDELNRCGPAYAVVCKEIMPTEKRGEIGSVKPSGWQTSKYEKDVISDMYLYNRCHLIGYQLAGENANEKNLVTGTRFMNVVGMLPYENAVDDYIEANPDNHVLYEVTPVFDGDNLVCYGVVMSALSCEDRGEGVSFCVFCPNVQPKVSINYANGDNELSLADDWYTGNVPTFIKDDDAAEQPEQAVDESSETAAADTAVSDATYILNTNSMKIHRPDCESVSKMSEKNKQESNETLDTLIAQGYEPCKNCLG